MLKRKYIYISLYIWEKIRNRWMATCYWNFVICNEKKRNFKILLLFFLKCSSEWKKKKNFHTIEKKRKGKKNSTKKFDQQLRLVFHPGEWFAVATPFCNNRLLSVVQIPRRGIDDKNRPSVPSFCPEWRRSDEARKLWLPL